jgi:hypothetical protein
MLRALALAPLLALSGCTAGQELSRLRSPDNRIDAVLIEHNRRADLSDYEIHLVPVDREDGHAVRLAYVRDASRYPDGPGLDVRWHSGAPPEPNVQTVFVSAASARDFRIPDQPPQFRSGVVSICYAAGGLRGAPPCSW